MNLYDPDKTPNPKQWLALDGQERIRLAEEYHRVAGISVPNRKAHAVFHATIENQIAEGLEPVVHTMARLIAEGLSRHDAIHAIASVLAEHLHELFNAKAGENKTTASYVSAVEGLTARGWLSDRGHR